MKFLPKAQEPMTTQRDPVIHICDMGLRVCAAAAVWASGFDIARGSVAHGLVMLLVGAIAWVA